jgi:hypothetical protein
MTISRESLELDLVYACVALGSINSLHAPYAL